VRPELGVPQKELLLRFLVTPLGTDAPALIESAAKVAAALIDETTAYFCHALAFGQRMLELARGDLQFAAQRGLFLALLRLLTYGVAEQAGELIGGGFMVLLAERIQGLWDALEDDFVTAVTVLVRFGNEDWVDAVRAQDSLLQVLLEACDLDDEVRDRLLDGA
jgi:hypothetical protein